MIDTLTPELEEYYRREHPEYHRWRQAEKSYWNHIQQVRTGMAINTTIIDEFDNSFREFIESPRYKIIL